MTSADAAKKVRESDSSRSRMATDYRDNFGAHRLHPMVTNWRCRLSPVSRASETGRLLNAFGGIHRARLNFYAKLGVA